jgi:hypothetical protein
MAERYEIRVAQRRVSCLTNGHGVTLGMPSSREGQGKYQSDKRSTRVRVVPDSNEESERKRRRGLVKYT